jgi:hypothetical protein
MGDIERLRQCLLYELLMEHLKFLSMILREGFSNVQQGILFGNICGENERIKAYATEIEWILNIVILGDEDGPAQWVLLYDDEKKTIGVICLDNKLSSGHMAE